MFSSATATRGSPAENGQDAHIFSHLSCGLPAVVGVRNNRIAPETFTYRLPNKLEQFPRKSRCRSCTARVLPLRVCRQAIRLTGGQLAVLVVGIRKPLAKRRRIIPRNKSRRKVLPYFNVCLTAPVMRCHFLHPRLYYNRAQWRSLSNKDLRRVCASRSNKTRFFAVCESLLEIPMLYPTELRAQRGFKDF